MPVLRGKGRPREDRPGLPHLVVGSLDLPRLAEGKEHLLMGMCSLHIPLAAALSPVSTLVHRDHVGGGSEPQGRRDARAGMDYQVRSAC